MPEAATHKISTRFYIMYAAGISFLLYILSMNAAYYSGHDKYGLPATHIGTSFYITAAVFALLTSYCYIIGRTNNLVIIVFAPPFLFIAMVLVGTFLTAKLHVFI